MRKEFKLTAEQHNQLIEAAKPVPFIVDWGGRVPPSPQENSKTVWERLGQALGFDFTTVRPVPGKSDYHFSADPVEST